MLTKLLGSNDLSAFLISFFFALIGVALSLLWQTTNRDIRSDNTPFAFSWRFLFSDNIKRILTGVIMIYVAIRFYPDLFGKPVTEYLAFGIGLGLDKIAEFIKNKTNILDVDRSKLK